MARVGRLGDSGFRIRAEDQALTLQIGVWGLGIRVFFGIWAVYHSYVCFDGCSGV